MASSVQLPNLSESDQTRAGKWPAGNALGAVLVIETNKSQSTVTLGRFRRIDHGQVQGFSRKLYSPASLRERVQLDTLVTLRLVLSMALRNHEGNEAQVCFFIIQLLLLKPSEFRNR